MNCKTRYNSDEILEIFKEQHRLCAPFDGMVDASFILTKNTFIWESYFDWCSGI